MNTDFRPGEINVIPPSATAAELGKYGMVPVSLSTGSINVDIPLHTLQGKNLNLPISLSYNGSGIKVDQVASWVGLGWSLNAGGVITRMVKDESDYGVKHPYPSNIKEDSYEAYQYIKDAGELDGFDSEPDVYAFNFMGYNGKFTFLPDGKPSPTIPLQNFEIVHVINETTGERSFEVTDIEGIKYLFAAVEKSKVDNTGSGCGKSYDVAEITAWYLTKIIHPGGDEIIINYSDKLETYYSAVDETIQKFLNMSDVDFLCGTPSCLNVPNKTCVKLNYTYGLDIRSIEYNNDSIVFNTSGRSDVISGTKVESITVYYSGVISKKIKFNYSYAFYSGSKYTNAQTSGETRSRLFLDLVKEYDKNLSEAKSHTFSYYNRNHLPPRLSYAQDHYGYFNGKDNNYFVPKDVIVFDNAGNNVFEGIGGDRETDGLYAHYGMLSRIDYPTGGYSTFEYEPHTYYSSYEVWPAEKHYYNSVQGISFKESYTEVDTVIIFDGRISLNFNVDPNQDADGLHNFAELSIKNITSGVFLMEHFRLYDSSSYQNYLSINPGDQYEFTITSYGESILAHVYFDYHDQDKIIEYGNLEIGGARINNIRSYTEIGKAFEKHYEYNDIATPLKSSGIKRFTPYYYSSLALNQNCDQPDNICATYTCNYGVLSSSSINNILPFNGGHVTYKNVIEKENDDLLNGYKTYEFLVNSDYPGEVIYGDEINNAPLTNFGWSNGLEKEVNTFNSSGVLLSQKTNFWKKDNRYNNEIPALIVQKKEDKTCEDALTFICDETNINAAIKMQSCVIYLNGFNRYLGSHLYNGVECEKNETPVEEIVYYHPCNGKTVGETAIWPIALERYNVFEYKNINHWFYLDSTVEKIYNQENLAVITYKKNKYNNLDHIQLNQITTENSDGNKIEQHFYYPQDYDSSLSNYDQLDSNHIVKPVKVLNSVEGKLIQGTIAEYNDKGQVKNVYKYESDDLQDLPNLNPNILFEDDYKYVQRVFNIYDVNKNLKERVDGSGITSSYKWGHNNKKLVASAINAAYNEIFYEGFEEHASGIDNRLYAKVGHKYKSTSYYVDFTPPSGKDYLISYFQYINGGWNYIEDNYSGPLTIYGDRLDEVKVYPNGSSLSSYSYNPDGSLYTLCDPNGKVSYNEYDAFGRLKFIKDNEGNILKRYDYNYKTPGGTQ
ncbi:MAG: hypothetical protein ACNS60_07100 [Candidatus Cyclobacteriaceae bacterium M2_1C_046]